MKEKKKRRITRGHKMEAEVRLEMHPVKIDVLPTDEACIWL